MSVERYWHERLNAGSVFFGEHMYIDKAHVRARPVPNGVPDLRWPYAVNKAALHTDYENWYYEAVEKPWALSTNLYDHHPPPKARNLSEFWQELGPLIFVYGGRVHSKRYNVQAMLFHRDLANVGRIGASFCRLLPLTEHIWLFEAMTTNVVTCDPDARRVVDRLLSIRQNPRLRGGD